MSIFLQNFYEKNMNKMIGYYKNDIIIANMWLARDINIYKKYILLQRLLLMPKDVKVLDNNLLLELNHINVYKSLDWYDFIHFSFDPVYDNIHKSMNDDIVIKTS